MSIFRLHQSVIDDYTQYVKSFFSVLDDRIREYVEGALVDEHKLWPDALIQLNPCYEEAGSISDLTGEGKLHHLCAEVFRAGNGMPFRLFRHQKEAIEKALAHNHYIVTSGTGSGKTLTFLIPIFDSVLKRGIGESKVKAVIVYPMNALVNSQMDALKQLAAQFKKRTGLECPIRFGKYTGQESREQKEEILKNPPHILLTNYVMLELMLVRPEERRLLDKATSELEFLVIDELHTYRGRQGADVGLLIRRLRERCGNPSLLCIGTSATMVAGKATSKNQRQMAVAQFAEKLFGIRVDPENVIEETIKRAATSVTAPTPATLKKVLEQQFPAEPERFLASPLTAWVELVFGIEEEADGNLRRKPPISFKTGAKTLSDLTGLELHFCETRLQEFFLLGATLKSTDARPLLAFKLHQFIGQGRTVYSTIEPASSRVLSLEGQYFASGDKSKSILYPLQFCRVCGQEYYSLIQESDKNQFIPFNPQNTPMLEDESTAGYLMLAVDQDNSEWDLEHIPTEWFDRNGKVKKAYRHHVPRAVWVSSDGAYESTPGQRTAKVWFSPKPFLLCLNCGEFYTLRDKNDFRKLSGLSSEGRSTSTTVMSISTLRHAKIGGIRESGRKILSFMDNRQDASLQSGHFNDFVQVSFMRSGILAALEKHKKLPFDTVARAVAESLGLGLSDVARTRSLRIDTPQGREVWKTFQDLVEYRLFGVSTTRWSGFIGSGRSGARIG